MRAPRPVGPPPDEAALRQAALSHLARYGTTRAGLLRVLSRRVQRWARAAEAQSTQVGPEQVAACLAAARVVVERLAAAGAVNDALFAESRARSLHRAGRSRRAISAHLQARGVPGALAAVPDDPAAELEAALLYAARRRMGPFREAPDAAQRMRDMGRLARAGFGAEVAMRTLDLAPEEAEALLWEARRS